MQTIQRLDLAELTTRVVGDADVKLTVVLLHGFGAPGDDLVALAQYISAPARFVFPEAPIELGGLYGDARAPVSPDQARGAPVPRAPVSPDQARGAPVPRAWWLLDLMRLEEDLRTGSIRDRRAEVPEGLEAARTQLLRFLDELQARFSIEDTQLVLGGFSQGAMLSLDVALHREHPPAALILMSGTLLAESIWQPRMKRLAGVPVFQSHGLHDALLPFAIAELMRDELAAAGASVDWHEFHGGHEIPPGVLDGVGKLLAATGSTSR